MSLPRPFRALLAAGVATVLAGSVLAPSTAAAPVKNPVAKDLLSPLSIAVNHRDHVFYSENFGGVLWVKKPGRKPAKVYSSPVGPNGPAEVGAISTRGDTVFFVSGTKVMKRSPSGTVRVLADLGKVEANRNPDGGTTYGISNLSDACKAAWPTGEQVPPPSYKGIVESHPYATAYGDGAVFVADAAANAIFRVKDGRVRVVKVLRPVAVTITPQMASSVGFPECAVGKKYRFEPVPTDVEYRDGRLFVASLPGGPEDGSVPGSVLRIRLATGRTVQLASGLVSATGLAVAANGTIFVTELFAGKVTRISPTGRKRTFVRTPFPSAVEVKGSRLYVSENVLSGFAPGEAPAGRVVWYRR